MPPVPTEERATPDALPGSDQPAIPIEPLDKEKMLGKGEKLKGVEGKIKEIADAYVVPMSDQAIKQWADHLKGEDTKPFEEYAKHMATGMYPTLAPQLEMGLTTKVLLDPYKHVAQQVLGPQESEPNWTDPKWSAALEGGVDPKTGRPGPMSLSQWGSFLRSEPAHGYDKSPEAMARTRDFLSELHNHFTGKAVMQ